jgi:hypothetical protein
MVGRRSYALVLVAVLAALAGLTAGYVNVQLAEPDAFADRAIEALRSEEVRAAIAEQAAVEIVERDAPDLVASRPLVLAAVEAVLETDAFGRILRRAAVTAHRVLLRGDRDVIVELEEARAVLVPAVESVSPDVARRIPAGLSPRIAEIRRGDVATFVLRAAESARLLALPLLLAALAALGFAVAGAADRRRALTVAGVAVAAGAVAGIAGLAALRAQAISHTEPIGVLSEERSRAAAGAAWDAFAGDLGTWLVIMAIVGLAVAAGGLLAEFRVDRAAAVRRVAEVVAGGSLPDGVRALRGVALAGLGVVLLLRLQPFTRAAVVVVGCVLLLLGAAEAVSTLRSRRALRPRRARSRRGVLAAVAACAIVAGTAVAVLSSRGGPPAAPQVGRQAACNGERALCDRRLDQVVFPGTHNSMSAADRPGWFFANQVRPIPRQLEDGIRLLLIDAHYGVVDAQGRVRTDLTAEGTDRNRVARRLGSDAVRAAERLAGRLDLVPSDGKRQIYLCHTLCELGAERMSAALGDIRGFLERNPSEVLVVLLESSITPEEVVEQVEDADLEPYVATLRRGGPLPSLGEMVASGRRLVLLDQGDGGEEAWFQPADAFVQGTRVSSLLTSPTACPVGSGTPESPLFQLNHWIDRFPPPATENAEVNDRETLLRRVRRCREVVGRAVNLLAVDFYERSGVVEAARELNRAEPGA